MAIILHTDCMVYWEGLSQQAYLFLSKIQEGKVGSVLVEGLPFDLFLYPDRKGCRALYVKDRQISGEGEFPMGSDILAMAGNPFQMQY